MKVFYSSSSHSEKNLEQIHDQIQKFLDQEGHENINEDFFRRINKQTKNPQNKSKKNYTLINKLLLEKLQRSDLCLFECSTKSLTIGFLIQKALELEKPAIALYGRGRVPAFLLGLENEKFQAIEYNKENLLKLLKSAFIKSSLLTDKRFNFFVSSSMLAYLNSISRKRGVTKSTFIRNLIEDYRRKNS